MELYGALIIGQSAVDAGIISPILIIIVAFTGITSFAIPDYSLGFHCRVARFAYLILGYLAGFLGIAVGIMVHILIACKINSFGVSYLEPYVPTNGKIYEGILLSPPWKQELRPDFLDTKRNQKEPHISMQWKYHESDKEWLIWIIQK